MRGTEQTSVYRWLLRLPNKDTAATVDNKGKSLYFSHAFSSVLVLSKIIRKYVTVYFAFSFLPKLLTLQKKL